MDRPFGTLRFWTTPPVENREQDSTTLRLHCETTVGRDLKPPVDSKARVVAAVTYWEGAGHFYLETLGGDVPVEIIEELIAEAKDLIRLE